MFKQVETHVECIDLSKIKIKLFVNNRLADLTIRFVFLFPLIIFITDNDESYSHEKWNLKNIF